MNERIEVLACTQDYLLTKLRLEKDQATAVTTQEYKTRSFVLESGLVDITIDNDIILMVVGKEYTVTPQTRYSLIAYKDSVLLEVSVPEQQAQSWTDFSMPRAHYTSTDNYNHDEWNCDKWMM